MTATMRTIIFWAGSSLLFLVLLVRGIDFGIADAMDSTIEVGISPKTWPAIVTLFLCLISAYLTFDSYKRHRMAQRGEAKLDAADIGTGCSASRLVITLTGLFVYYVAILYLGITVPSLLFFLFFTMRSGEKRLGLLLLIGIPLCVGLYYFFLGIARIPMPTGPLGGII